MEVLKLFFDPRGCIGRKAYFVAFMVNIFLFLGPVLLKAVMTYRMYIDDPSAVTYSPLIGVMYAVLYLCGIISFLFITIKRFRDLGINGFLGLVTLIVPIALLLFQPGNKR